MILILSLHCRRLISFAEHSHHRYGNVDERGVPRYDLEVVDTAASIAAEAGAASGSGLGGGLGSSALQGPAAKAAAESALASWKNRPLKIGDVVRRGPHWKAKHGNKDGGGVGKVIALTAESLCVQ